MISSSLRLEDRSKMDSRDQSSGDQKFGTSAITSDLELQEDPISRSLSFIDRSIRDQISNVSSRQSTRDRSIRLSDQIGHTRSISALMCLRSRVTAPICPSTEAIALSSQNLTTTKSIRLSTTSALIGQQSTEPITVPMEHLTPPFRTYSRA